MYALDLWSRAKEDMRIAKSNLPIIHAGAVSHAYFALGSAKALPCIRLLLHCVEISVTAQNEDLPVVDCRCRLFNLVAYMELPIAAG